MVYNGKFDIPYQGESRIGQWRCAVEVVRHQSTELRFPVSAACSTFDPRRYGSYLPHALLIAVLLQVPQRRREGANDLFHSVTGIKLTAAH